MEDSGPIDPSTASKAVLTGLEGSEKYLTNESAAQHSTILGSPLGVLTIKKLLEGKGSDAAFTNFCSRVSNAIGALNSTSTNTFTVCDLQQVLLISLMLRAALTTYIQVREYQFIKVKYESFVDWTIKEDYLRCNPSFHGNPRYDFVIANLSGGHTFARLVFVFTCQVAEQNYRLALIQRLKKQSRTAEKEFDKNLSIHRWQIRPRDRCEVVPIDCVVRGALLVKDPKYVDDYFVIDTLDEDMYLRVKKHLS